MSLPGRFLREADEARAVKTHRKVVLVGIVHQRLEGFLEDGDRAFTVPVCVAWMVQRC